MIYRLLRRVSRVELNTAAAATTEVSTPGTLEA